jgi:hypothetical protein
MKDKNKYNITNPRVFINGREVHIVPAKISYCNCITKEKFGKCPYDSDTKDKS